MKNKKFFVFVLFLFVICFALLTVTACQRNDSNSDSIGQTETEDSRIFAIYQSYVENVISKGDTPLSYEEWLETIQGEKGEKGDKGDRKSVV